MGDTRTEALKAALDALRFDPFGSLRDSIETIVDEEGPTGLVTAVLDAIPADVLARLAIERGALQQVGWHWREATFGSPVTHHWKPSQGEPAVPVYRLTTEGADE